MNEQLQIGDMVEIISINSIKPMPGGLGLGSRGTVIGSPDSLFFVHVDYGIGDNVWSRRDSIRKVRPPAPQDWVELCNLTSLPQSLEVVS